MTRKTKIKISITGIVLVTLSLTLLTVGYFLRNKNTIPNTEIKDLKLLYKDGTSEIVKLNNSNTIIKDFTITNNSEKNIIKYEIYLENIINEYKDNPKLTITCTSTINEKTKKCDGYDAYYPKKNTKILSSHINKGETRNYKVTIDNLNNEDNKNLEGKIQIYEPGNIIEIIGSISNYKDNYYIELENFDKTSRILSDGTYLLTGINPNIYTLNIKNKDKIIGSKVITISTGTEESISSDGSNITITNNTKRIKLNIDVNDLTIVESNIEKPIYLKDVILSQNNPQSDELIDFNDSSINGLYYTNKNTINNQTTYYFRGNVNNNYVKFGKYLNDYVVYRYNTQDREDFKTLGECQKHLRASLKKETCQEIVLASSGDDMYWRIVRINEDGSIRLIYQGTNTDFTKYDSSIGRSPYNVAYDNTLLTDNAYVGYMFGSLKSKEYNLTHANTSSSNIKKVIDNWYENSMIYYSHYLTNAGFCNDRSIAENAKTWATNDTALGYGVNLTYYGAYNRLSTNTPQFKCIQEQDLFTTSISSIGNNALTYPVGLITADEIIYAGGNISKNYYINSGISFYTMSPYSASSSNLNIYYENNGYLNNGNGIDNLYVRPVINLSSEVELVNSNSNGTIENIYEIKID